MNAFIIVAVDAVPTYEFIWAFKTYVNSAEQCNITSKMTEKAIFLEQKNTE